MERRVWRACRRFEVTATFGPLARVLLRLVGSCRCQLVGGHIEHAEKVTRRAVLFLDVRFDVQGPP
jgi:hypothetical protein